jgi:hypothetical protein
MPVFKNTEFMNYLEKKYTYESDLDLVTEEENLTELMG